jgi:HEAT repeat protein
VERQVAVPIGPRPAPHIAPAPAEELPIWHELQGRGSVERISEQARELARQQAEMAREQSRMAAEMAREQSRMAAELAREQSRVASEMAREQAFRFEVPRFEMPRMTYGGYFNLPEHPPVAWAQGDPADSLYRAAQEAMNKGDYRKAAMIFKEIPAKYKYSQYAADAMYWQAHALYRVGTNPDLQEALQALEQLKATYPNSRIRGNQADVGALQVRIAGVLNARGQGGSDIVKRALAQSATTCDNEEMQIRGAALNALMQTDETAATEYAIKVLARKDECTRELRRSAVFLIGNRPGPRSVATLISVAKSDPSADVRSRAIEYLGRAQSDDALAALEDLMKSSDEQDVQRAAVRAMANNTNPRARNAIKALVERNDVNENQRITALDALSPERATQEDVTWLQGLYGKVESARIRSRIITAMGRIGGAQNERWFTTLANNENESIDVRVSAIRQVGMQMDLAALGRLYDQTGQRQLRYEIVRQLGSRREPESIDKLGEIAKNGTDVEVRMRAIDALRSKKDERANKLILQLIDRP